MIEQFIEKRELQFCRDRVNLEFQNLRYYPPGKKDKASSREPILKGVSGKFNSGQLTALLGPSGAGKSSLLNVLTGFKTAGVTGTILVNGKERNVHKFRKKSCYIPQEIAMLEKLTTKETIEIAADLKLESSVGKKKKIEMINEILEILGLEKSTNTLVTKLSGGEKKRLSIGLELLTNPPVMFFDEPTSGLDSISALQVICHLKSLANAGRTVVCSIHQPSSCLFEMFDEVFLLANGQCLYTGPNLNMTQVFGEAGFQCPTYYNRADYAIEIATKQRSREGDVEKLISRFRYKKPSTIEYQEDDDNEKTVILKQTSSNDISVQVYKEDEISMESSYPQSTWKQFTILYKRTMLCYMRDLVSIQLRILTHVVVGLLLGVVYFGVGNNASQALSNVGSLVFFMFFLFFLNAMTSLISIPIESSVVVREHLNNWYSLKAYYFSKIITDIPLLVMCTVIFLVTGYFMTNQPYELERFLKFSLICLLVTLIAHNMGLTVGTCFTNIHVALFVLPTGNIPLLLFSGFFLTLRDVPIALKWMTYVSYHRYAFEGLMLSVYGSGRPGLDCNEIYCYFKAPTEILEEFGLNESYYMFDVLALVIWMVLLQIATYCALKYKIHKTKSQ